MEVIHLQLEDLPQRSPLNQTSEVFDEGIEAQDQAALALHPRFDDHLPDVSDLLPVHPDGLFHHHVLSPLRCTDYLLEMQMMGGGDHNEVNVVPGNHIRKLIHHLAGQSKRLRAGLGLFFIPADHGHHFRKGVVVDRPNIFGGHIA